MDNKNNDKTNDINVELHILQERIFANDPTVWDELASTEEDADDENHVVELRKWPTGKKSEPYDL